MRVCSRVSCWQKACERLCRQPATATPTPWQLASTCNIQLSACLPHVIYSYLRVLPPWYLPPWYTAAHHRQQRTLHPARPLGHVLGHVLAPEATLSGDRSGGTPPHPRGCYGAPRHLSYGVPRQGPCPRRSPLCPEAPGQRFHRCCLPLAFNDIFIKLTCVCVERSYHQEYRRSHQNSQLKPVWAGLVLG